MKWSFGAKDGAESLFGLWMVAILGLASMVFFTGMYLCGELSTPGDPTGLRQFVLHNLMGLFFAFLGFVNLLGRTEISVDKEARRLTMASVLPVRRSEQTVDFQDVESILVRPGGHRKAPGFRVSVQGPKTLELVLLKSEVAAEQLATELAEAIGVSVCKDPAD